MKNRVLSGMRPTGKLHLGNYHGALENWKGLQDTYDCFFFIADWHALTSDYEDTANIESYIRDMVIDWLSVGLDPEKCTLFIQSHIKEHSELYLLFSMITPVPWLERNPTYKEQIEQLSNKDLSTFGFLGYPVLQAADIVMYKAKGVPVGVDQIPHVELTREIVRRFNHIFEEVFPEPKAILTPTPKILGIDRRKMSKSYQNAIFLCDSSEFIQKKVSQMITDPQRMRKNDPGDPSVCNVFTFHTLYSEQSMIDDMNNACKNAKIGCVDCKKKMAQSLISHLEPIRDKRTYYESKPNIVNEIIHNGEEKARSVARETMNEVRSAVKTNYFN